MVALLLLPVSVPNTLSAQQLKRLGFVTNLEGDDVQVTVEYSQMPEGPTYAARSILKIPAKELEAKIENFDFLKQ